MATNVTPEGHSVTHSNIFEAMHNRRAFLIGAGAIGATGLAGAVGVDRLVLSSNHHSSSSEGSHDRSINAAESLAIINSIPDNQVVYTDDGDPHILDYLNQEQVFNRGCLKITDANEGDVNARAQDFLKIYKLYVRAGEDKDTLLWAANQKRYSIGERDQFGILLTEESGRPGFANAVNDRFGIMLKGMGPDTPDEITIAKGLTLSDIDLSRSQYIKTEFIKKEQARAAKNFVAMNVRNDGPSTASSNLAAGTYFGFQNAVELSVKDGLWPGFGEDAGRMQINFTTQTGHDGAIDPTTIILTYLKDQATRTYQLLFEDFSRTGRDS